MADTAAFSDGDDSSDRSEGAPRRGSGGPVRRSRGRAVAGVTKKKAKREKTADGGDGDDGIEIIKGRTGLHRCCANHCRDPTSTRTQVNHNKVTGKRYEVERWRHNMRFKDYEVQRKGTVKVVGNSGTICSRCEAHIRHNRGFAKRPPAPPRRPEKRS